MKKRITDDTANIVGFSSWLKSEYPKLYNELILVLKKHNIRYRQIPYTKDIWCRDYMPIQISEDCFVCYRYQPDYLLKNESCKRYITDSHNLCTRLKLNVRNTDIIIDGGNVVKIGNKIIMTDKVFKENSTFDSSVLQKELERLFECEIVFLPWDCLEEYGHADGIVKPISEDTVLITNYDDFDIAYYKKFKKILSRFFKVESLHYDVKKRDARNWVYINFLTIGKLIILPKLNIEEDQQALSQMRCFYPDYDIEQLDIEELVAAGGGLNCISWCYYQ